VIEDAGPSRQVRGYRTAELLRTAANPKADSPENDL
jgi:hypothetical protein